MTWKVVPGSPNEFTLASNNDNRFQYVESLKGVDWAFDLGTNVGCALFRQQGQNGVEILYDVDIQDGSAEKQIFNYALSNGGFEP